MRKLNRITLLLAAALAAAPLAYADDTAAENPLLAQYEERGTVDRVSKDKSTILIGDSLYKLSTYVRVQRPDGVATTVDALRRGTPIAYNSEMPEGQKRPTVVGVLILGEPKKDR